MHHCVNISTGVEGNGQGVLLRAVEPLDGIELMRARRGPRPDRMLADGPGKLAQAFGLTLMHNGDLAEVYDDGVAAAGGAPRVGPAVGITKAVDWPRRFRLAAQTCASAVRSSVERDSSSRTGALPLLGSGTGRDWPRYVSVGGAGGGGSPRPRRKASLLARRHEMSAAKPLHEKFGRTERASEASERVR